MTVNNDAIVVAANGGVYVGAVGATAPTDPAAAIDTGVWTHLGGISDDGVSFQDSKTLENINIWQSFYPARRIVTEKDAQASFELREWNVNTVPFAFGGGSITEPTAGIFRYEPPAPEIIDERAMVIQWVDGDKDYLLVLPRGMVTEAVETELVRSDAANLPITFGINGQDGIAPWYLLTNDPAFEAAGS